LFPGNFAGRLSIPTLPAHDEFAEGIRRYSNPVSGIRGKVNVRLRRGCP
jgi:hypothetical protein